MADFVRGTRSHGLGLLATLVLSFASGCGRTPQLNGNEESLGAADALWTAVTAKDVQLVDTCAARLSELHDVGTLPDDAFATLNDVIATARSGEWTVARQSLKAFAKGQRPAAAAN